MSQDARYLLLAGLVLGFCLLFAASINAIVDPYGFYRWFWIDGFNAIKPRAEQQVARNKARGIIIRKPDSLILGNSRAEIGINPESAIWGVGHSTYNAAIPGSGPMATVEYLQHALTQRNLKRAVIGLEFLDFLADPADVAPRPVEPNRDTAMDSKATLHDAMTAVFSLDAVEDSFLTILSQRNPFASTIDADGFNPMHDYEGFARTEGYGALFAQRNRENARIYMKKQKRLEATGPLPGTSWQALNHLRDLCDQESIQCYFVIYPYHADIMELFDATGLWPVFEEWKREVVSTLATTSTGRPLASEVWDFSGYNEFTTEPVPSNSDRKAIMRWYWEAGHFKSTLGEKMLQQILNHSPEAFGARLDASDLEVHLAKLRDERERYRRTFPGAAARMQQLLMSAKQQ